MKLSLFFADKARSILRLHDPYPSLLKGIGTSAVPGLSEGCRYNGLLESIKLGALVVVEPDSSIAMINEINSNPENLNHSNQNKRKKRKTETNPESLNHSNQSKKKKETELEGEEKQRRRRR